MDKVLARRIEHYCGGACLADLAILLQMCIETDRLIGIDLFYSITTGISYDELYKVNCIPTSKTLFYKLKNIVLEKYAGYLQTVEKNKVHDPK